MLGRLKPGLKAVGRYVCKVRQWPREVHGFLLALVAVYLMPALATYTPRDLGAWTGANPAGATEVSANFFGPLGAHFAWMLMAFLGLAAWLVPAFLLYFGLKLLLHRLQPARSRQWLWASGAVVASAVFFATQPWYADRWAVSMRMITAGGILGKWIGIDLLKPFLGVAGVLGVSALGYGVTLCYAMGASPLELWRDLAREFSRWQIRRAPHGDSDGGDAASAAVSEAQDARSEAVSASVPARRTRRKAVTAPIRDTGEVDGESESFARGGVPEPEIIDGARRHSKPVAVDQPAFARTSDPAPDFSSYRLPPLALLHMPEIGAEPETNKAELIATQNTIISTLQSFGVDVTPGNITRGPTITRYEIYPAEGLRVSRITQLENDIARATKAERINILAPIPGRDTVGIEIANLQKVAVPLSELLADPAFTNPKKRIPIALGKDVYGNTIVGDLAAMPHLLVAGATGSGKSVCINAIISSILFRFRPDELRFILVDPKIVEMQAYSHLPHLISPVVTNPDKVIGVLRWAVNEMEKRYALFAKLGVRNFESFNNRPRPVREAEVVAAAVGPGGGGESLESSVEVEDDWDASNLESGDAGEREIGEEGALGAGGEEDAGARAAGNLAGASRGGVGAMYGDGWDEVCATAARLRAIDGTLEAGGDGDEDETFTMGEGLPRVSGEGESAKVDNMFAPGDGSRDVSAEAEDGGGEGDGDEAEGKSEPDDEGYGAPSAIPSRIPGTESMSRAMSRDEEELFEDYASGGGGGGSKKPAPAGEAFSRGGRQMEFDLDSGDDEIPDRLPYIVIIIDELADLMQTAPADMESYIARITQKARAAGIHLIIATQTPRADVVTGIIKANVPCRIAFQVSSALDSRVILDTKGAEKLVGKGDLLYLPPGSAKLERAQGAYISDPEVDDLVKHCSEQADQHFASSLQQSMDESIADAGEDGEEAVSSADEEILQRCIEVIRVEQKASASLLQRRLRLGYNKASRMIDILEQRGYVGPGDGAKPREVYLDE